MKARGYREILRQKTLNEKTEGETQGVIIEPGFFSRKQSLSTQGSAIHARSNK